VRLLRCSKLTREGIILQPQDRIWKPLTKAEVSKIADASFKVLDQIGVYVDNEGILRVMEKNGCNVDHSKKLAYLPEEVAKGFIKKAPTKFTLAGRSEQDDVFLDPKQGKAYGCFSSPMPRLCVWDANKNDYDHRDATEDDLSKFVRLYDALEHVDVVIPPTLAMDVAKNGLPQHVHELYITLSETTRHISLANAAPKTPDEWDYYVRLAAEVVGGEEELRKRPIISGMSLFTPPLRLAKSACFNLLGPAKYGLPLLLGGANAPLTIPNACNTVVHHASVLANLALAQMVSSGISCMINVWGCSLDLYNVTMNFEAPENQLLNCVLIQMVHDHLGIPVNFSPAQSAKLTDIQAGYEATIANCFQWMTGCDLWTNYTFNDYEFNPEMLIFQNELAEYFNHMGKRFADTLPTDENIAFDAIRDVGPLTDFLTHNVTLKNIELQYKPELADYRSFIKWSQDKENILNRIRNRRKELEEHVPSRLSTDVMQKMKLIVNEADHKLGMQ
jgi:trimethylamine--corrinoid protein Co-methyltransferase